MFDLHLLWLLEFATIPALGSGSVVTVLTNYAYMPHHFTANSTNVVPWPVIVCLLYPSLQWRGLIRMLVMLEAVHPELAAWDFSCSINKEITLCFVS